MSIAELMLPSRCRSGRGANGSSEPPHREGQHAGLRPDAFAEANGIAALFAAVRPCDGASAVTARSSLRGFEAETSATSWILERGLKLLGPRERQRIVDGWGVPHRDRSPSLITDGGCDVRIGDSAVTGVVRGALLDWVPLSDNDLAVYEGGLFREAPANALTLLLRPPTIWSIDEALISDHLFPRGPRFEPARFEALERHARGHLRSEHLARLREATARVEKQLPVERFPGASATVAAGCAAIARDDDWCAAIAARQLARYATSALIDRAAEPTSMENSRFSSANVRPLVHIRGCQGVAIS
jgi:hypothetical protein